MSAWIVRQAPSSGAASWLRANWSTRSHHSRARSQSPALVQATTRLQYAEARVWTLRTRPADAAAIASSSSTIPASRRPALTSLRPSTLSAKTSRSPSASARAISMARRAYAIWSVTAGAVRARWTATQPCPAQRSTSARARSARASQPRAADVRPAISCWLDTQTATRAASLQRPSRDVRLEGPLAAGDAVGDLAEEPERQPEPLVRRRGVGGLEDGLEAAPGLVPLRLLEGALGLDAGRRPRSRRSPEDYPLPRLGATTSTEPSSISRPGPPPVRVRLARPARPSSGAHRER